MSIQSIVATLKREVLEAWYLELRTKHDALCAENNALLTELQETQLTLNDERNNLALASAELRNLRAWQAVGMEEARQSSTQH